MAIKEQSWTEGEKKKVSEIDYAAYRNKCKELKNLLAYGSLNRNLVFIKMEEALANSEIHEALKKKLSYREFWNTQPQNCIEALKIFSSCRDPLYIEIPSDIKMNSDEFFRSFK